MSSVLHVLDHSLPEQDGYSFRSHAILTQLDRAGLPVTALTGPKQGPAATAAENVDGIQYLRTSIDAGTSTSGIAGQLRTIRRTRRRIGEYLAANQAGILHAHSPCLNGLASLGLGRPVVYEMRSSWEDAAVSVGTTQEGSLRYRVSKMLETYVASRADAVVVICEGLRDELLRRGIPDDRISVVPNALPEQMFTRPEPDDVAAVKARFALQDCRVVAFFGSFFEWEGVDRLITALPIVLAAAPDVRLFIAGGGRQEEGLHALAAELQIEDRVVFAGRIAHEDIKACYAAADVMVYPRLPDRLTDMVTPLKPLEAMAQGTLVVASDVGGHRELIDNGRTGILFSAGSHEDLARTIVDAVSRPDAAREMTERALRFVQREKRWSVVAERYRPVYAKLMGEQRD